MTSIPQLIFAFMQIGITAFGGGLSTLPLIEYQLVTKNGWMGVEEFNQMVAVSQVTPGPIAINAATFAGYQQAGFWGSFASTLALVAAPLMALSIILFLLQRVSPEKSKNFKLMLRPVVAGLLTLSIISPFTSTWNNGAVAIALFAVGVGLIKFSKFFKENPATMLIIFGIFGAFFLR
ncbi:chromate transporter [Cloacibacillus porcorum]|jgi:chromate transporter|uniref:Chromate transporter n=1 Tax=Cloacibacillus porcorum TaxID=1197717 RepID=A0A1B2I902_9BACT|nr:chromate transporter [Cloacibacillus porcorum]ANZ46474.1 hypothetical protein BED41_16015 [Cloacibacillus porcorum]